MPVQVILQVQRVVRVVWEGDKVIITGTSESGDFTRVIREGDEFALSYSVNVEASPNVVAAVEGALALDEGAL